MYGIRAWRDEFWLGVCGLVARWGLQFGWSRVVSSAVLRCLGVWLWCKNEQRAVGKGEMESMRDEIVETIQSSHTLFNNLKSSWSWLIALSSSLRGRCRGSSKWALIGQPQTISQDHLSDHVHKTHSLPIGFLTPHIYLNVWENFA